MVVPSEAQEPTLYNAEAYKSLLILADTLDSMLSSTTQPPVELQKMREDLRQALFNYKEVSTVWGSFQAAWEGVESDLTKGPVELVIGN